MHAAGGALAASARGVTPYCTSPHSRKGQLFINTMFRGSQALLCLAPLAPGRARQQCYSQQRSGRCVHRAQAQTHLTGDRKHTWMSMSVPKQIVNSANRSMACGCSLGDEASQSRGPHTVGASSPRTLGSRTARLKQLNGASTTWTVLHGPKWLYRMLASVAGASARQDVRGAFAHGSHRNQGNS